MFRLNFYKRNKCNRKVFCFHDRKIPPSKWNYSWKKEFDSGNANEMFLLLMERTCQKGRNFFKGSPKWEQCVSIYLKSWEEVAISQVSLCAVNSFSHWTWWLKWDLIWAYLSTLPHKRWTALFWEVLLLSRFCQKKSPKIYLNSICLYFVWILRFFFLLIV